jgi:hypothetical protein
MIQFGVAGEALSSSDTNSTWYTHARDSLQLSRLDEMAESAAVVLQNVSDVAGEIPQDRVQAGRARDVLAQAAKGTNNDHLIEARDSAAAYAAKIDIIMTGHQGIIDAAAEYAATLGAAKQAAERLGFLTMAATQHAAEGNLARNNTLEAMTAYMREAGIGGDDSLGFQ